MDLAIAYHRPESLLLKLKTPKTTTVKKNQRYQLAEHISVNAERMMKTACTGLPLAVWKDTIVLPQQKKSYGVTVDFRRFTDNCTKNQCQNFFQLCLVKINVFCKVRKYFLYKRFRLKKSEFFRLRSFFLHRKRTKSNCIC